MATNNFHYVNASCAFVVCDRQDYVEDDDTWYDYDLEMDDLRESIKVIAEEEGLELRPSNTNDRRELRSFPSQTMFDVIKDFNVFGVEVELNITMIVRQGYYSSACLDWQLTISIGDSVFEDTDMVSTDDIADAIGDDYFNGIGGECAKQYGVENPLQESARFINEKIEENIAKIEAIFKSVSNPFRLLGTASNGEAFYEKINK